MTTAQILDAIENMLARVGVRDARRSLAEDNVTLITSAGAVWSVEQLDGSVFIVYQSELHIGDPDRPVSRRVEVDRPVSVTTVERAATKAIFDPSLPPSA